MMEGGMTTRLTTTHISKTPHTRSNGITPTVNLDPTGTKIVVGWKPEADM